MSDQIPAPAPRACECTYRSNLGAKPQLIEKNDRKFVSAQMGVNMAAPNVPREEQDELTEWVDVIAFSETMQMQLLDCEKGAAIAVFGTVTKKPYERSSGETGINRTIVAEYIRTATAEGGDSGDHIPGSVQTRLRPPAGYRLPPTPRTVPAPRPRRPFRPRSARHAQAIHRWRQPAP